MKTPEVCIIAALAENRVIGNKGQIPWRIPEDMKHFKELTMGHPVIMGRKTWDSIDPKYKPLPGRENIILTRDQTFTYPPCLVAYDLCQGIKAAKIHDDDRILVMGGGQIYEQALPMADRLYLTIVEGQFEGDTYFPDYSEFSNAVSEELRESNGFKYKFVELTR